MYCLLTRLECFCWPRSPTICVYGVLLRSSCGQNSIHLSSNVWLFVQIEMKRKSENELLGIEKRLFPLLK